VFNATGLNHIPDRLVIELGHRGVYPGKSRSLEIPLDGAVFVEVYTEKEAPQRPLKGGWRIDE
jgi:hypothetical protein